MLRWINGALAALLLLFAAVQWNDPDGPLWMAIYGVGAFWTALAAFRPRQLAARPARALLVLTVAAAVAGLAFYWPRTPDWWRIAVWWETETAREGMGMMILLAALAPPLALALRRAPEAR